MLNYTENLISEYSKTLFISHQVKRKVKVQRHRQLLNTVWSINN
jgi:hypothetical protein